MSNDAMLKRAKELVVNYFNDHVEVTDNKKSFILLHFQSLVKDYWLCRNSEK